MNDIHFKILDLNDRMLKQLKLKKVSRLLLGYLSKFSDACKTYMLTLKLFSDRLLFSALQDDAFRGQRLSLLGKITLRGLRLLQFSQESRPFATKLKLVKITIFTKRAYFKELRMT
ncbi:hypothetical protein CR205_06770 [Alteribacter lacisalsi]|uniref:Uncharacterized protein n=1 Tax=Alteribacter lacisalsi TaxID=2045244 RepID=A0A2W0HL84_9BACI|nr:hypothetical protein CR205_06770 [Alteribacter lacisalsi]